MKALKIILKGLLSPFYMAFLLVLIPTFLLMIMLNLAGVLLLELFAVFYCVFVLPFYTVTSAFPKYVWKCLKRGYIFKSLVADKDDDYKGFGA